MHQDGNYTSWDEREQNQRIRLDVLAYYICNELGDEPIRRSASFVESLAPRRSDADLIRSLKKRVHQNFWGATESDSEDELELYGTRDELAILGVERDVKQGAIRLLSPTYGQLACVDRRGLLRCRQIGFDVIDVDGEQRMAFLVDERDCDHFRQNPAVAVSVAKYRNGGAWLQSQGLIELHEESGKVRSLVRRLESRYARVHSRLALNVTMGDRIPRGYVLASLAHQKLSSRYREAERSIRSAEAGTR
ncbi:hypothetical protein ACIA74_43505 [Streptomyces sp. NPDC051658]|uniref:hypothetical protein n=1 Tax=Streptomyces sp. NPDC051658 TaxID=3365667 RepID=UPI0037B01A41